MKTSAIRHDWALSEIQALYDLPLLDLIFDAATVHRQHHNPRQVQVNHIISVKIGGCPEDCKYCSQAASYQTGIQAQPLLSLEEVLAKARVAIQNGVTRICLGASGRNVRPGKQFDEILKMVKEINAMGVEVCCTLGMLDQEAAQKLADAGTHSYNHNLDSSREYYSQVVTTRTYQDRLDTLDTVEKTTMKTCCGGILGLGESVQDRLSLLHTLSTRPRHPASVPINLLSPVPGTPMEKQPKVPFHEFVRIIALARLLMPKSMVRLSSGRITLSLSEQALCYLAGANSIHSGGIMLTTAVSCPRFDADSEMLALLGLEKMPPFQSC